VAVVVLFSAPSLPIPTPAALVLLVFLGVSAGRCGGYGVGCGAGLGFVLVLGRRVGLRGDGARGEANDRGGGRSKFGSCHVLAGRVPMALFQGSSSHHQSEEECVEFDGHLDGNRSGLVAKYRFEDE
jgi:hypothetical protein